MPELALHLERAERMNQHIVDPTIKQGRGSAVGLAGDQKKRATTAVDVGQPRVQPAHAGVDEDDLTHGSARGRKAGSLARKRAAGLGQLSEPERLDFTVARDQRGLEPHQNALTRNCISTFASLSLW